MPGPHRARERAGAVPVGFRINRSLPVGRHPILVAFPGLGDLGTARRWEPDPTVREQLLDETCVEVVEEDVWMYVAPRDRPRFRGWRPVVSGDQDCIVVGEAHLRESPALTLFLDIFHELCHIVQRRAGKELFDRKYSYSESPTEIDAYRFVVGEARRLGVGDPVLREYLKVEWIDDDDFLKLLTAVGVPAAP